MLRSVVAVLTVIVASSSAMAQVMYQPVRYQFDAGSGDQKYLYGGVSPQVHRIARHRVGYATNLHHFDGGNSFGQPSALYERAAVYTDAVPFGQDASRFGFNEADARNEAYANAPTYFRKADLLASALPAGDGSWVVPANAPRIETSQSSPYVAPLVSNPSIAPRKGQIIIIPKNLLNRPLKDFDRKPEKVATAQ